MWKKECEWGDVRRHYAANQCFGGVGPSGRQGVPCNAVSIGGRKAHNELAPPHTESAESAHLQRVLVHLVSQRNTDSQTRPISCLAWCSSARPRPPSAHPTLQRPFVHLIH